MRAVVVTPGQKNSSRLAEVSDPTPSDAQVRVKVIRVGVCGTDAEIDRAEYGEAPPGESKLILGHESFGVVETVGHDVKGFKNGVKHLSEAERCWPGWLESLRVLGWSKQLVMM